MAGAAQARALEARIDAFERAGQYDEAIAALEELGRLTGEDQRWHIAWMHVQAGRRPQAQELWEALGRERPGDPAVPFLAGNAELEAGDPARAAERFGAALELALTAGADGATLREIAGARSEALAEAGLEPGPVDEAARLALARAAAQGVDTPVATPFFARTEFDAAVAAFPAFAADWEADGHAGYAHELDQRLRAIAAGAPRHPVVVPLTVAEVQATALQVGVDGDAAQARARAAYDRAQDGRAIAWPPGRNEPCWCGSGTKYKRCCGR